MYHHFLHCLLAGYAGALLGVLLMSLLTIAKRNSCRKRPHRFN